MGFESDKLLRCSLVAQHNTSGDTQVNTLHYDLNHDVGGAANSPQDLADRLRDDVVPKFRALYTSAWTILPVTVQMERDPLQPNEPRQAWTSGAAQGGLKVVSGDLLPRAVCAVATLRTENIGRRYRGRMFIGGSLGESDQADGVWGAVPLGAMQQYLDSIPFQPDISGGISGSTANWCVYSRTQRAENLDPYASHVVSVQLHSPVHWLRSRQP